MEASRPPTVLTVLAALVVVTGMIPAATASHQQIKAPPPHTGIGNNDVRDEPDHGDDTSGDSVNGFGECSTPDDVGGTSCQSGFYTQVLEGFYESNYWQVDVDWNNILRVLTAEAGADHQDRIYPGTSYFNAYWGWWQDKGSGHQFQDGDVPASEVNPLAGDSNGAIDDAHDNKEDNWDDDPNHGVWDEFVWRGKNPWAGQHADKPVRTGDDPIQKYPGDAIKVFISPGTHRDILFPEYALLNEFDSPQVPDLELSDRTDYEAYTVEPIPQFGGWVNNNGWMAFGYDMSLLIATQVKWAVNPADVGDEKFDPDDATATDTDVYTNVAPAVEDLYRTTVWDPDQDYGDDENEQNVYPGHPQGPKQDVKDTFTPIYFNSEDEVNELYDQVTGPAKPVQGFAEDAAGSKPRTHEPNVHEVGAPWGTISGDDYPGASCSADPCAEYGDIAGDYYQPQNQDYSGYAAQEHAWLDMQATWGSPIYVVLFSIGGGFNFAPAPNADAGADQTGERTATPGFLSFSGNFGTWWDADDSQDSFVGDLDEYGRITSSSDPYRSGDVSDPNDYDDHASQSEADPSKTLPAEWNGLVTGGDVTLTVTPLTDGQRWGETGVYIFGDDSGQFNPYDDIYNDVLDDGDVDKYRQQGSITLTIDSSENNPKEGNWFARHYLVFPTGNPNFDILVESQGEVQTNIDAKNNPGDNLNGETVRDVDVVSSWT